MTADAADESRRFSGGRLAPLERRVDQARGIEHFQPEVESLLTAHREAGDFAERLAFADVLDRVARQCQYEICRRRAGMGQVYRAPTRHWGYVAIDICR